MFGSKLTTANKREGDGKGAGLSGETDSGRQGPFSQSRCKWLFSF